MYKKYIKFNYNKNLLGSHLASYLTTQKNNTKYISTKYFYLFIKCRIILKCKTFARMNIYSLHLTYAETLIMLL